MITPSFSLTATERVLPRMALDFTTASLDSRITFTRTGNTATVTNSSGYVVSINADLPRFDYDAVTLACKGLLIEESRTNLLLRSQEFDNIIWAKTRSSAVANAIVSPNNTLDAEKIVEDTSTNTHFVLQSTINANGTYTFSVYVKAAERSFAFVGMSDGVTALIGAYINLTTGALTNAAGGSWINVTSTSTSVGNGWWRVTVTATRGAGTSTLVQVYTSTGAGTISYTGNGTSGIYLWGAQLEAGAFATSYIPTVAATVTRNADVATMTSTNFSSWYTATTGAAVVWAIPQAATGTRPLLQFDDTTALEIITLRGNVADPELYIVDGGVAQAQIDAGTIVANTAYKLSGAWNTNSCAAAQNGAAAVTDNTATIPTPTQLRIGSDGTNYASAIIQKVLYYPQRIINAEVQAISK